MQPEILTTRYSDWSPGRARLALAVMCVAIGVLLSAAFTAAALPVHDGKVETDVDLFRKVVLRVHAGEGTDDAFERVFKEYNYPVCSIFNYRALLHPWFIGHLPEPSWGQAIWPHSSSRPP